MLYQEAELRAYTCQIFMSCPSGSDPTATCIAHLVIIHADSQLLLISAELLCRVRWSPTTMSLCATSLHKLMPWPRASLLWSFVLRTCQTISFLTRPSQATGRPSAFSFLSSTPSPLARFWPCMSTELQSRYCTANSASAALLCTLCALSAGWMAWFDSQLTN